MRLILGSIFLLISVSASEALCSSRIRFHFTSEGPWMGSGQATNGKECQQRFHAGGNTIFKRLYLKVSPQHGSVRLQQGGMWAYTPLAGYHGQDQFTLRICGIEGTVEGCGDLIYQMAVE
jgi:Bacterial Ig domain